MEAGRVADTARLRTCTSSLHITSCNCCSAEIACWPSKNAEIVYVCCLCACIMVYLLVGFASLH